MKNFLQTMFYGKPSNRLRAFFDFLLASIVVINIAAIILQTTNLTPSQHLRLHILNICITCLFACEYILRLIVSPNKRLRQVFSFTSIVDIVSIFPALFALLLHLDWTYLTIFRIFRVFKLFNYLKSMRLLMVVFEKTYRAILVSLTLIAILTVIAATLMYFAEHQAQPHKFPNILASMYWAVITITSVGYGDIYPITVMGKVIASFIAILGVFAFAIPTGIISAGFISEFNRVIQLRKERRNLMKQNQMKTPTAPPKSEL